MQQRKVEVSKLYRYRLGCSLCRQRLGRVKWRSDNEDLVQPLFQKLPGQF